MMLALLQVLGLNQGVLRNILLKSVHCNPIHGRAGIKQGKIIFTSDFPAMKTKCLCEKGMPVLFQGMAVSTWRALEGWLRVG